MLLALVIASMVGLALFAWRFAAWRNRRIAASCVVADRLRDGDLAQPVVDNARDEFSPPPQALQQMQDSPVRVVGTVRQSADGVAIASTRIGSGKPDLSHCTEQQASSLQQTAALVEQSAAAAESLQPQARQRVQAVAVFKLLRT